MFASASIDLQCSAKHTTHNRQTPIQQRLIQDNLGKSEPEM